MFDECPMEDFGGGGRMGPQYSTVAKIKQYEVMWYRPIKMGGNDFNVCRSRIRLIIFLLGIAPLVRYCERIGENG